ncbi:MAG: uracil-DNA glycosylase [Verrucomicrobiota bacterium]
MKNTEEDKDASLAQVAAQYVHSLQCLGESEVALDRELVASLKIYGRSAQREQREQRAPQNGSYQKEKPSLDSPAPHVSPTVKESEPKRKPYAKPGLNKLSLEEKRRELEALRKRSIDCQKCSHLARSRKQVVFGEGSPAADIMFVGEAPGADEDKQGEPFVGAAGQLLTKMIQAMDLTRDDVYIGNVLKCRPDMPPNAPGNRKPTLDEMNTCRPYLAAQIGIIQPKVLVALGSTAVEGVLGKAKVSITRIRGQWHSFEGIPLMPTFHPAYLLYQNRISDKRKVWEDLLMVMEQVGMPISEKQRNFFLNQLNR